LNRIRLSIRHAAALWAFTLALPAGADPALAELAARMTGVFSSAGQAKADSEFRDVRLVMVPVWTGRTDGPWLYVEQAIADALDRPYRQRVYRLRKTADGQAVESVVYALPGDPLRFAAAWKQERPLADLAPADLLERTGCAIRLERRADGAWAGATSPKSCPSDLRGASYATSEVEIGDGLMGTWDRGHDAEGKQVWGAEKGGYRFVKVAPRP
jgi:hypothetical protein